MKKGLCNGNFRKVEREGGEIVDYYRRHFWHEDIQNTPHYLVKLCTRIALEPLRNLLCRNKKNMHDLRADCRGAVERREAAKTVLTYHSS